MLLMDGNNSCFELFPADYKPGIIPFISLQMICVGSPVNTKRGTKNPAAVLIIQPFHLGHLLLQRRENRAMNALKHFDNTLQFLIGSKKFIVHLDIDCFSVIGLNQGSRFMIPAVERASGDLVILCELGFVTACLEFNYQLLPDLKICEREILIDGVK